MTIMVITADDAPCIAVSAFVWAVVDPSGWKDVVTAASAEDAAAIVRGRLVTGSPAQRVWVRLTVRRASEADLDAVIPD